MKGQERLLQKEWVAEKEPFMLGTHQMCEKTLKCLFPEVKS